MDVSSSLGNAKKRALCVEDKLGRKRRASSLFSLIPQDTTVSQG
jgi:hypothetical protein